MKTISRREINVKKWDSCINQGENRLIYGQHWFLDASCNGQWEALIWGDYHTVLPLPYKYKLGIKTIYMPYTVRYFPLFGHVTEQIKLEAAHFLENQQRIFFATKELPLSTNYTKTFCLLPLNKPYEELWTKYRKDRKRDVKKKDNELQILPAEIETYSSSIEIFWQSIFKQTHTSPSIIHRVFREAKERGQAILYKAMYRDEIVGILGAIKDENRIYLQSIAASTRGYSLASSTHLINRVIHDFANQDIVFDFMGSSVDGIRAYNNSFGAKEDTFQVITKELLLFQLLKKLRS